MLATTCLDYMKFGLPEPSKNKPTFATCESLVEEVVDPPFSYLTLIYYYYYILFKYNSLVFLANFFSG